MSSSSTSNSTAISVIDSHVHLWPASEQDTLAWMTPDLPIAGQHSLDEYLAAVTIPVPSISQSSSTTSTSPSSTKPPLSHLPPPNLTLKGLIYLETDRLIPSSSPLSSPSSWTHPLTELSFLSRLCGASPPLPSQGHSPSQSHLPLALIPWAPVPAGPASLSTYFSLAAERSGSAFKRIKGVRYLVQDKPEGTMGQKEFVEGVKWLGRKGLRFDLGVDIHRRGEGHLRECVEFVGRCYDGVTDEDEKTIMIVDHCAKPDLSNSHKTLSTPDTIQSLPEFTTWRTHITLLSLHPTIYIKLSGFFTELDPSFVLSASVDEIVEVVQPWVAVLFETFGPSRILFGSDWPVCEFGMTGGGGGGDRREKEVQKQAWGKWVAVVQGVLGRLRVGEEDRRSVWGGSAGRAYGLDEDE